ncbi:CPBP family intramembrane glutamic endopeptidase [Arthrobacter sp. B0490]|uniref:CPBP family intramembrane glutamic endopeptidase n=1 Tax=Arthrobacter sp. B0490 TaxID=2058891 RepID=UPI000CE31E55|nr:type II CAAX endopeptidase family protein [Arthrobacter sp. B0490]
MQQVDPQYEFHRLALSWPWHRWWKPLLTALLGFVFYVVFVLVVVVAGLGVATLSPTGVDPYLDALTVLDLSNPVMFAFTLVSLILMIPALALAALIMGPKPLGLLSSVAGRIRWTWLAVCTAAALAVFLASLAVSTGIGFFFPEDVAAAPAQQDTSILVIMLALSLLAVPFQAAAEEYVFRGFLMQAIGSWLKHPAFAILLPVPLFVLGHGYDPLGQADVALFAVFAGWITWRTGGLEAAIAVHAINNMTIFVLGAFGLVDVNSTEGSVSGLVVSALTMAVTAVVIVRLADRRGIARTRTVAPQPVFAPAAAFPGQPFADGYAYRPRGAHSALPPTDPAVPPWTRTRSRKPEPTQAQPVQPLSPPAAAPATGPGRRPAGPAAGPGAAPAGQSGGQSGGVPSGGPAAADRDYSADRHPAGPAHPDGPGHPPGVPHPAGPGYPGAGTPREP